MITMAVIFGLGALAALTLAGMYKAYKGVQGELERLVAKDDGERM